MAKRKVTLGSTQYTRTGLIDTMNQVRAKVDRVILNLIYNPNSNIEVLKDISNIKTVVKRLPDRVVTPNLFGDEKIKAEGKEKGRG